MITKTIEPTGEVCVKFTDEELSELGIKQGDKFSVKEVDKGILLEKYATIDLEISEWSRDILEMLISESCEKDISVNQIIEDIINSFVKNENLP
jgi:bifunctional DNA-binding transcriptional regulator/antitoxin component of YhaV-PrlF toxin-antitoxin module